jgi:EAL domain-containing protein (putative c-di-GMP-specific phosphodiesterase class I)
MLNEPTDLANVKAIVELGHELGLPDVAEGVESHHEAEILCGVGCENYKASCSRRRFIQQNSGFG